MNLDTGLYFKAEGLLFVGGGGHVSTKQVQETLEEVTSADAVT